MKKSFVVFVHGRPSGHPLHAKYAKSITDDLRFEDPWIRWQDRFYPAPIRYLAWIINSLAFVSFRRKIVVTECLRITLVLSKIFSLNRIKLVMLVADESPYFIFSKYYSTLSRKVNVWSYNQFDAFICIGKMETSLVKYALHNNHNKPVLTSINGVSSEHLSKLGAVSFHSQSNRIVFIGNGPANWRAWYKGVDLMLQAFSKLVEEGHDIYFDIAGDWNVESLTSQLPQVARSRIKFWGKISDLQQFLTNAALYLHIGRGEAWGLSINEAMAAGVVPIVSEWTGAKECVEQVSPQLVVSLDADEVFKKLVWFFQISPEERMQLSNRCKEIAKQYSEEKAIARFKECFEKIEAQII